MNKVPSDSNVLFVTSCIHFLVFVMSCLLFIVCCLLSVGCLLFVDVCCALFVICSVLLLLFVDCFVLVCLHSLEVHCEILGGTVLEFTSKIRTAQCQSSLHHSR